MKTNKIKLIGASLAVIVGLALPTARAFAATATTTINGEVGSVISVSSSGTVNISVTPVGSGVRTSSAKDAVVVNSNATSGYNLTLAMEGASQNLTSGSNTIAPASGTQDAPAALGTNTWGYRIDNIGGFGAGPTTALSSAESYTSTFAAVPKSGSANNIASTSAPSVSGGDNHGVWYAMSVDASQPTGIYAGKVVYTATVK